MNDELNFIYKVIEYLTLACVGGLISLGVWIVKTQLNTTHALEQLNLKVDHNQLLEDQHNEIIRLQVEENMRRINKGETLLIHLDDRVKELEKK